MLLPFRLISASLKQLSRDITNDIIVKQNIFDVMQFLSNSEFQTTSMKKATTETSWENIILTSSIILNSCFTLSLSLPLSLSFSLYINNGKKCPVNVTRVDMISIPPFNPKPSITLSMLPRKLISR